MKLIYLDPHMVASSLRAQVLEIHRFKQAIYQLFPIWRAQDILNELLFEKRIRGKRADVLALKHVVRLFRVGVTHQHFNFFQILSS